MACKTPSGPSATCHMAAWRSSINRSSMHRRSRVSSGSKNPRTFTITMGFQIDAQALQADRFQQLLQRPGAAGKGDSGVAVGEHKVLSFAHIFDHLKFGEPFVVPFQFLHEARNHSDNLPALCQHSFGKPPHRTDRAATIDCHNGIFGEDFTHSAGRTEVDRVRFFAGRAINTDFADWLLFGESMEMSKPFRSRAG